MQLFIVLLFVLIATVTAWTRFHKIKSFGSVHRYNRLRKFETLSMGIGDMFKKAFENESLPPPKNPGLSKELEPVVIEFLPSKKSIKALPGQKLSVVAQSAGVDIKYSCKKGDCGTCSVKVNGSMARACQTSVPNIKSKISVEVLPPKGSKLVTK